MVSDETVRIGTRSWPRTLKRFGHKIQSQTNRPAALVEQTKRLLHFSTSIRSVLGHHLHELGKIHGVLACAKVV